MDEELELLSPAQFPSSLREIPGAPKKLYVRGKLPSETHKWLAVVGSRSVSTYGRQAVRHLIEGLRGYPVVIVSGLAYGVDAEAHKAALACGLTTVAVPGSGLSWQTLYPRANVALARDIVSSGGALISEFEPNFKATEYSFPQRNRVMAGLSQATLVVEAREKSGSLITARLAADYNRDVLVVPGSIFSLESKGAHQFLRLGATAITGPQDLLQALGIEQRDTTITLRTDVSDEEMSVLEALTKPLPREQLIESIGKPVADANILLSMMELKGLIVEELGFLRIR